MEEIDMARCGYCFSLFDGKQDADEDALQVCDDCSFDSDAKLLHLVCAECGVQLEGVSEDYRCSHCGSWTAGH
ncbi:MAG: DNA-directed RNA polymerase subunit RPC12/RpoP [Candidatus Omnitrophota bacterium]|jgi:DNA-directed RNA polymerase subunit RPC12/RpoP